MERNIWEEVTLSLDDDERIVFPDLYEENIDIFDKVCGVAYIIKDAKNPDAKIEWIWGDAFKKHKEPERFRILKKVLIARLRAPWHEIEDKFLISREEYLAHKNQVRLLDIYARVQDRNNPKVVKLIDADAFLLKNKNWAVLELKYLVALRSPFDVEPIVKRENVHTFLML